MYPGQSDFVAQDVSRYLAEMKSDALGKIFPSPEELSRRIPLISHLTGRHPNIAKLYKARVHFVALQAMRKGEAIPWEKLDPVAFLMEHAPSLGGERAQQAVDIARATPREVKRGFFESLFGGRR